MKRVLIGFICACLLTGCSQPKAKVATTPTSAPTLAPKAASTPSASVSSTASTPAPAATFLPPGTVIADARKPETIPSGYTSRVEDEYVKRAGQILQRLSNFPSTDNPRNDFAEAAATVEQMQNEFTALGRPPYRLHKFASLFSECLSSLRSGFSLAKTAVDLSNRELLADAKRTTDNGFDLGHRATAELRRVEKGTP